MTRYSSYILFLFVGLLGCQTLKRPLALVPIKQPSPELPPLEEDYVILNPGAYERVYDNSPEIKSALKEFAKSGKASIVKRAGFVQFPFGEVQPILNCRPDYGCDIELQAGEEVQAVILGNEPLWDYLVWQSNQEQTPVSHVTIGPRVRSARTNAIIGTDRRTYHLELLSTKKADYIRSAKFYYPRERLRTYQRKQKRKRRAEERRKGAKKRNKLQRELGEAGALAYQYMSFGWQISGSASWKPIRVFDDGAHIYLQFSEHVIFEDFPGVYIPSEDEQLTQPVWRAVKPTKSREQGQYIMVDGMYDELRLVGGFGDKQETVSIYKE